LPLYDYDCAACGRRFEVIHGVHGDPPAACPLCGGGPVRKAITAASVHYKGTGWAKKERRAAVKSSASRGDEGSADAGSSRGESGESGEAGESGASGSEAGSTSSDDASRPSVPASATAGESGSGTSKAAKSGTQTKSQTRRSD